MPVCDICAHAEPVWRTVALVNGDPRQPAPVDLCDLCFWECLELAELDEISDE